ncbi:hypothetical protein Tco_1252455 [Tanacetum coccineum]
MTRSSTEELVIPYNEPEQVFQSSRKLSRTRSLDYLSSPEFDLFSDPEDHGTNGEYTIEHIENFLEIVNSLNIPKKSKTNGNKTKVEWDPTNIEFENWRASKFRNHKTMDQSTKNALWDYLKRRDDEEEFNYLSQIDVDVLTKDIPRFKTYEEYKDDWIYEWNNGMKGVNDAVVVRLQQEVLQLPRQST